MILSSQSLFPQYKTSNSCLCVDGYCTNQGLIYPKSQEERLNYNDLMKTGFPGVKKIFVTGNHDVGFQDDISRLLNLGSWNKGISKKSFEAAERLIGPAWNFFKIKNFNLLIQ